VLIKIGKVILSLNISKKKRGKIRAAILAPKFSAQDKKKRQSQGGRVREKKACFYQVRVRDKRGKRGIPNSKGGGNIRQGGGPS